MGHHSRASRLKKVLPLLAVVCIALFLFLYTRPHTLRQWYPQLDLADCLRMEGEYRSDETAGEWRRFTLHPGEEGFTPMASLFQETGFRLRLSNLLPRGRKHHEGGGTQWQVTFLFDSPPTGALLQVSNFYGQLTLTSYKGDLVDFTAEDQDRWLEEVYGLIRSSEDGTA